MIPAGCGRRRHACSQRGARVVNSRYSGRPEPPVASPVASAGTSRPRPPRLIWPPFRPAARASSAVHSCAVPFSCAARPPLLAISRCFSGDIDANPRRSLRTPSTVLLLIPERSALLASDYVRPRLSGRRRWLLDRNGWGFGRRCLGTVIVVPITFRFRIGPVLRLPHVHSLIALDNRQLLAGDVLGLQAPCQPSQIVPSSGNK